MPTNLSLKALRDASPQNQPDFDRSLERYEALRAQITATPHSAPQRSARPGRRRRLIRLSATAAAAAVVAGVIFSLSLDGASPQSAYATARKALAATSAANSGTMTVTATGTGTQLWMLYTTRWTGKRISLSSGAVHVLGRNRQLILIGGGAYLQRADGTWVHYATEADIGPKLGPAVQLARENVAGNTANQILALATNLRKTVEPDGTTVYTGTIPNSNADPASPGVPDAIVGMITKLRSGNQPGAPGGSHPDSRLTLIVGRDGLVRRVSLTFHQRGATSTADTGSTTWSVRYSHLADTRPISAPTT
jgi:hypothetical protein